MAHRYPGAVRAPEFPESCEWIGPRHTLRELRGKLVLLDFWTYCCINCMHIVPNLREIERRYPDELVVIGVHSAKFPAERVTANVAKAVDRLDISHPVINDADHAIWDAYAVGAWPTLMLIDPLGRLIGTHAGEFDLETFDAFISDAIAEFDADGTLDRRPLAIHREPSRDDTFLRFPAKVLADQESDLLFIADTGHHRIVITTRTGDIIQVIGSGRPGFNDGAAVTASFNAPHGLALSPDRRRMAVCDTRNHAIRTIDLVSGHVKTVAGTGAQGWEREAGPALEVALGSPWDLAWRDDGIWIAMAGWHQIWSLDLASSHISPLAGTGAESIHDDVLDEATFAQPSGLTLAGDVAFVADSETSAVRRVDRSSGRVSRIVGRGLFIFGDNDGRGDSVRLQHPLGITGGRAGDRTLYLVDSYNHRIKALDPVSRAVTTLFGNGEAGHEDGSAESASFWEPGGISYAAGQLYIADTNNHGIRICDLELRTVGTIGVRH